MDKNLRDISDIFKDAIDLYEDGPGDNVWEGLLRRLDKKRLLERKYFYADRLVVVLFFLLANFIAHSPVRFASGTDKKEERFLVSQNAKKAKRKVLHKKTTQPFIINKLLTPEEKIADAAPQFMNPAKIENTFPVYKFQSGIVAQLLPTTFLLRPVRLNKKQGFHFALTPFFSTQFNYSVIDDDDSHNGATRALYDKDDIKSQEQDRFSYNIGLMMEIPFKKRWSLQTGFIFISRSLDIVAKEIYAQPDNNGQVKYRYDCSCGFAYLLPKTGSLPAAGDSINIAGSSNNLQYAGIPVIAGYRLGAGKFTIMPSAGVSVNFLIAQKIETSFPGTGKNITITDIQGLKKTYFNAYAGLVLQYNPGKKIAITLTPASNFALGSINKNAAVKTYPDSFGIAAGMKVFF